MQEFHREWVRLFAALCGVTVAAALVLLAFVLILCRSVR